MEEKWRSDDCSAIRAQYAVYSVPEAAARWCGVTDEFIDEVVKEATPKSLSGRGRSIWTHPAVPCLEPRSRAIAEAIESGDLPHGREDGTSVPAGEHVAHERRHVMGRDLKDWMKRFLPNERPAFLFDDIERSTHEAISIDAYRSLKAENDRLLLRLEKAKSEYLKLREENEEQSEVIQDLKAAVEKAAVPGEKAKVTYLKIIGSLVELMLAESPGGQPYSVFKGPTAIIDALVNNFPERGGISERTLHQKFGEAKRECQ